MYPKQKPEDEAVVRLKKLSVEQPNKRCFDCAQRGPTYINVTIGAFVCSTCGGLLRGLSTPHRIKSISMATFSQTEVQLIEQRGNEVCKSIWLGKWVKEDPPTFDKNSDNGRKDLLSDKYEKKLWYVDPSQATTKKEVLESKSLKQIAEKQCPSPIAVPRSRGTSVSSNKTPPLIKATPPAMPLPGMIRSTSLPSTAQAQPPAAVQQPPVPQLHPRQPIYQQPQQSAAAPQPSSTFNLMDSISSDPFSSNQQTPVATQNFANFDAFSEKRTPAVAPVFSSSILAPTNPNKPSAGVPQQQPPMGASASDPYAALADLDNTLRSLTFSGNENNPFSQESKSVANPVSNFGTFPNQQQQQQPIPSASNPFAPAQAQGGWGAVNGVNHSAPVATQHGFPQGGVSMINTQSIMSTGQHGPGAPSATPFGTFPAANSVGGPALDQQQQYQLYMKQQAQQQFQQQQQAFAQPPSSSPQQQPFSQQQPFPQQQQSFTQQQMQMFSQQQVQQQQAQQQQFEQQQQQLLAQQQQLLAAQMMSQQGIISTEQTWNQPPSRFTMQPNNPFSMQMGAAGTGAAQQTNPFT